MAHSLGLRVEVVIVVVVAVVVVLVVVVVVVGLVVVLVDLCWEFQKQRGPCRTCLIHADRGKIWGLGLLPADYPTRRSLF